MKPSIRKLGFKKYNNWSISQPKKKTVDNLEIVIDKIIKANSMEDKTHEIDKKDDIIPGVGYIEEMQALHKLCFYEEQNDNWDSE